VVVVISMIGHRVADGRAADAPDDRSDRTADRSPADSARDSSAYRAGFIRKSLAARNTNKGRRGSAEQKSRHVQPPIWRTSPSPLTLDKRSKRLKVPARHYAILLADN
jgi:hypothetical protein